MSLYRSSAPLTPEGLSQGARFFRATGHSDKCGTGVNWKKRADHNNCYDSYDADDYFCDHVRTADGSLVLKRSMRVGKNAARTTTAKIKKESKPAIRSKREYDIIQKAKAPICQVHFIPRHQCECE